MRSNDASRYTFIHKIAIWHFVFLIMVLLRGKATDSCVNVTFFFCSLNNYIPISNYLKSYHLHNSTTNATTNFQLMF